MVNLLLLSFPFFYCVLLVSAKLHLKAAAVAVLFNLPSLANYFNRIIALPGFIYFILLLLHHHLLLSGSSLLGE